MGGRGQAEGGDAPASRASTSRRRDRRTVALVVAGAVLFNLAALSLWSWRTFASSQGFADVATDMLNEPAVRQSIAHQIVIALEDEPAAADLVTAAGPVLEQVVEEVVGTTAFRGIFHASARQIHAAVFAGRQTHLLVPVDDAVDLVTQALQLANPALAGALPDQAVPVLVGISQSEWVERSMAAASVAGWLAGLLALVGLGCFVLAVRGARDRRHTIEWIGLSLLASGIGLFVLLVVGLQLVAGMGDDPVTRTALRAVFWSATHLLNIQAKVLMVTGGVVWIAAANAAPGEIRVRFQAMFEQARTVFARAGWRLLGCTTLLALGLFAMAWPAAAAAILVRILAFVVFAIGAVGLFDLFGSYQQAAADALDRRQRRMPVLAAESLAAVVVLPLVLLGGVFAVGRAAELPGAPKPSPDAHGCNGHVELCDRRIDEVAFAGSHNAMSASREDFFVANQTGGILAQLGGGIRALMLDFHYGWAGAGGTIRTDLSSERHREATEETLDPAAQAAFDRFYALFGFAAPKEEHEVYLCHLYCELGATPAKQALRQVASFARENPNEVLLVIVEDHVAPEDAVRVLLDSGLAGRAWTVQPGSPLPTLRQMVLAKRNVLVMAEYGGGARTWYHDAYGTLLAENRYRAAAVDQFSCDPGRGTTGNPLLLLNHWITSEGPSSKTLARSANSAAVLGQHADRCTRAFGRKPNIVAVDFVDQGDLLAIVDHLNGLFRPGDEEAAGDTTAPSRAPAPQ